jgi:hypothetical protein
VTKNKFESFFALKNLPRLVKSARTASQGLTCEVVTGRFLPCEIVWHGCSRNKLLSDNEELSRTSGLQMHRDCNIVSLSLQSCTTHSRLKMQIKNEVILGCLSSIDSF